MSLKCSKCKLEAPKNVKSFRSSEWLCEKCFSVDLKDELTSLYCSGHPGRYLYVSELTNNLDKIHQHFNENVNLNNPFCAVVLLVPEAIDKARGIFDGIYVDKDCLSPSDVAKIPVTEFTYIKFVNPTTQTIL